MTTKLVTKHLQDDFLLRHYDSGECQGKLGHSRASVICHRAQVGHMRTKKNQQTLNKTNNKHKINKQQITNTKHFVFKVIGIFAGFGILLLVASPLLLIAAPCIICCKCR